MLWPAALLIVTAMNSPALVAWPTAAPPAAHDWEALTDRARAAREDPTRWLGLSRVYGDVAEASALAVYDDAIVINSFSKYYAMPGWRVGWMVVPDALVDAVERLAQNLFICAPHVGQVAALAALDAEDELDRHRAVYADNRALLLEALPAMGFARLAPCDGAFYVYADAGSFTDDSPAFCRAMLEQAGVAATPGVDFDAAEGARWVRFSFAGPADRIAEGRRRLRGWLG